MATPQKIRCQVKSVIDHGAHVYTVDLKPERLIPHFKPGQFLHIALDDYDPSGFWPESRVFSIASPASQREHLSITYSVKGRFTSRMEKELVEGKLVWIKMPYGDFVINDCGNIVLFAGGTGITAFTAFLDGLTRDFPNKVYLAYGARNSRLLIYRDLVQRYAAMISQLQPFFFVEQEADGELAGQEVTVGRLSVAAMWQGIENPLGATFYISGPSPMLKVISHDLSERGIRADAIRIDAWE